MTGCCCCFSVCPGLWKLPRDNIRFKDVLDVSWCLKKGRRFCGTYDLIPLNGYFYSVSQFVEQTKLQTSQANP